MNVVLLSHEYPPFIYGGVGTFVHNLALGLSKNGVQVTVVAGYPKLTKSFNSKQMPEEEISGIKIIRLPYLNVPPSQTFFQLQNMRRIFETIKTAKPDIIHGQCSSTYPAVLNLKKLAPIVITFHGSPLMEKTIASYSLLRGGSLGDLRTYVLGYPLMSFVYRKELFTANSNVAVSKTLKSELINEMGPKLDEKISAIHNGVDLETLDKDFEAVGEDEESSLDVITYAGRLFWRKGPLSLIRLAYFLQKWKSRTKILVHGTGPLYGKMAKDIKTLGLTNIELKGFTSKDQLLKSIKRSKLVLIPSLYEACPLILLESMCLGKVPVMFNLPYSREFTEDGKYGILASDVKDMAKRIFLSSQENIEILSKEVSKFSRKEYDMKEIAGKYFQLYNEL